MEFSINISDRSWLWAAETMESETTDKEKTTVYNASTSGGFEC